MLSGAHTRVGTPVSTACLLDFQRCIRIVYIYWADSGPVRAQQRDFPVFFVIFPSEALIVVINSTVEVKVEG